ncbi:WD-REPEATS-REGION domain-containing protein [Mycena venus]|uniref:methylated diphthine methylhydrolase n=1 Tax=Mycena venus TaxID=2733690 RepID=A0A8H6XUK4_9AGAR|nr:WD-REPEATS-REGION domain-containing protein [Mycena venus]
MDLPNQQNECEEFDEAVLLVLRHPNNIEDGRATQEPSELCQGLTIRTFLQLSGNDSKKGYWEVIGGRGEGRNNKREDSQAKSELGWVEILNKVHPGCGRESSEILGFGRVTSHGASRAFMDPTDTIFPADAVEFCPHPAAQDVLVCGTYNLEKNTDLPEGSKQKRIGQCLVYKVEDASKATLRKVQTIDLPAVPDIKWCHRSLSAPPLLGVADSEGYISLFEWKENELKSHSSISCAASDILCLSLDWSNRRHPSTAFGSLVVSLSNGSLCLLNPRESGLSIADTWHAHDFEPWIAAWDYWDSSLIYSGGDDLKLKGWDTRQGFSQATFINKRFDAGVTTIQSHPHIENQFAVGSYDNTVRLFDKRKPLVPVTQVDVGGGAWRVKWHPSTNRKNDLLVACMHDGFKVVRFAEPQDAGLDGGEVLKRFDSHTSLAYGADWSFADSGDGGESLIASCSFYDHSLHVWTG